MSSNNETNITDQVFDKLDVNNIDFESICKTYFEASKYFDNTNS